MTNITYTAVILGLMGSFHCVGMCGPLALALPLKGNTFFERLCGASLYNVGRIIMYGLMGAVFGVIGQGFQLLGFQRWVSVVAGAILMLSVLLPLVFKSTNFFNIAFIVAPVRKGLQALFGLRTYGSLFLIGLLNGLLPCGLVYLAIAGTLAMGNAYWGIFYMILFGLGTLPMMLLVSLLGNTIGVAARNKINKVVPYIIVFVGVVFIFRGLCLGIPYLSPPLEKMNVQYHVKTGTANCCSSTTEGACCNGK